MKKFVMLTAVTLLAGTAFCVVTTHLSLDCRVGAIFAREYLWSDNLGDINRDGVPDVYIPLYGIGGDGVG